MRVLATLRGRIFLSTALLTVLSIGVAVLLVSVRVTRQADGATERELRATGAVVEQLRATRAQTFTSMARLLADTPTLKAAVDTNDPPTVQNVLNGYETQIGPHRLLVTSRTGDMLANVGLSADVGNAAATRSAVHEALNGAETFSLLRQADGMLQLITVPIALGRTEPDILGTLSVGVVFDDALARQLKQITGSEIAFGLDGQILSSTLPQEDEAVLRELIQEAGSAGATVRTTDYLALPLPLSTFGDAPGGSRAVALILHSRAEQLRVLRTIRTELAMTALVAVLLATLVSFAVARTITRPLSVVTDAMEKVAATGDLTRTIEVSGSRRWEDADAHLLATTFNTLTQSVARFQRETSQRERLLSLGRLSTVIAHEVRNPLMIIKAALHTLGRPGAASGATQEAVSDIDGEVTRLNRIVNEVLDFARPMSFELTPTDVNALCRDSAAAAQARAGAPVHLDLDPAMPAVVTDGERLRVALVNLIENARHAVELKDGGDPLPVRLSSRAHKDGVTLLVIDRGLGIREADASRVFDPYFTTKRGGTGLGLPIAKNIVEGLGGTIAITTDAGAGTTVRIDLPLGAPGH